MDTVGGRDRRRDRRAKPYNLTAEQIAIVNAHREWGERVARSMHRCMPQRIPCDPLVAAAVRGVVDAAARWSAEKGVGFKAFARPRVRGSIVDELRELDWHGRRRPGRNDELPQILTGWSGVLGEEPEADSADVQPTRGAISSNLPVFYHGRAPAEGSDVLEDLELTSWLVAQLKPSEAELLADVYGIGRPALTLRAIAAATEPQVTESRICQRVAEIKAKLRKLLADRGVHGPSRRAA